MRYKLFKQVWVGWFVLVAHFHSPSQITQDASLRLRVAVEKKINQKQELYSKVQFRMSDNFSSFNYASWDIGISNKITKGISLSLSYVFTTKRRYDIEMFEYRIRHRFYANINFKHDFGNFRISNRNQFQSDIEEDNRISSELNPEYFYRNKTTIKYQGFKKVAPFVYYEWYLRMNNKKNWEDFLYRQRASVGLEYQIKKRKSIELYYMYQYQTKRRGPDNIHAFYVTYNYSFKKPKKDEPSESKKMNE